MPSVTVQHAESAQAGETVEFTAEAKAAEPVVAWQWNFGDGVSAEGAAARHTWTEAGDYNVSLKARGIDGREAVQPFRMHVSGYMSTVVDPAEVRRPQ
jgi:chitodextrinase